MDSVFDFKEEKHTWFRAKAVIISCSLWMIFIGSFIFRLFSDSACAFVSYHKQSFNSDQYSPRFDNHTTLIKESVLIQKYFLSCWLVEWALTSDWLTFFLNIYLMNTSFRGSCLMRWNQSRLMGRVEWASLENQGNNNQCKNMVL